MADSDLKSAVLGATDIVQLIGQSVALKQRGKDYVGLCPFHTEKSPSFHVSPAKHFFHCYGCKAGGNAIDFVIKRDRVEFLEALQQLAERAGLDMSQFRRGKGDGSSAGQRQQLLDLQSAAAAFFVRQLEGEGAGGTAARAYLAKRGFTPEILKQFGVGYAPAGWDNLLRSREMAKFGVGVAGLMALGGLAKTRTGSGGGGGQGAGGGEGHYDTFRDRVMFPIRDETGRTIAFGGRVMPGSEDPAKYLNSPETPLFSKGRSIFGLDLGKRRIVESRTVAVVEGYTDVVMAHQFDASNVVSILGTALTENHLNLLRRFADRVVLLFDADAAGDSAVGRTIELFLSQPVELAIGQIPDGLDPDEFLLRDGKVGLDSLLANATDALTFVWRRLVADYDAAGGDMTRQQKAVAAYMELLANARAGGPVDPMRWGMALTRVSRLTGIPVDELNRQFKVRPVARPRLAGTAAGDGQGQATATPSRRPSGRLGFRAITSTADQQAERWLLAAILLEPNVWQGVQKHVRPGHFTDELLKALAYRIWDRWGQEGEADFAEFLAELGQGAQEGVGQLMSLAIELVDEHRNRGEPSILARDAMQYFAVREERWAQDRVAREAMAGPPPRSEVHPESGGSAEKENDLLKNLQEKARKPDMTRKPAV